MPSKTKKTSSKKGAVEAKKKKTKKAKPESVSDAREAQDPEKDRPKGHKEDSSDHDEEPAIENAKDISSYEEEDDEEASTSGEEEYSDIESDDDKSNKRKSRGKKSGGKRSGTKKSSRKRYRHNRDEEMLAKFRTVLREELHEKHAGHQEESFATALYHNFAHLKDISKTKDGQGNITTSAFGKHLKMVLNAKLRPGDSERLSNKDIEHICGILDSNGDGTIDWDEFVSNMSFSSEEIIQIIYKIRCSIKKRMETHGDNVESIFRSILARQTSNEGITESALRSFVESDLVVELSTGEVRQIFQFLDKDSNGSVNITELQEFLKTSMHDLLVSSDFDDDSPIVDIQFTVGDDVVKEDSLRHLGYRTINVDLNGNSVVRPLALAKKVKLWFLKKGRDKYSTDDEFVRDRVTDITISKNKRDPMLIGQGFKCIGQTLNHGLLAGKNVYLWIRKNINDPNPILNVAVTMGHKKNPKDPIHFPPFYGYKRCPGMVNNGGIFSLDVFLWYRKTAFTTDADRGKLRTSKDGFSPDAEMNTQIINHVRQVLREHCMFGDGKVDLARGFKRYDREKRGRILASQFRHVLEDEGIYLQNKEFKMLFKKIDADNSKTITLKDFFGFIQHGDDAIDDMARKMRRKIQGFARRSKKGLESVFDKYDKKKTGVINAVAFKSLLKEMKVAISHGEMEKFKGRFDIDGSGVISKDSFLEFVYGNNVEYSRSTLIAVYDKLFDKLEIIAMGGHKNKKRKKWQKAFDKLAFMGGAADHASDVDHADIKRLQMDYAFEKMIDDMEERDWICDEEMEILCDHFDPKHQKKNKFNNIIAFEDFEEGIEAQFEPPKKIKRKRIIISDEDSKKKSNKVNRMLHKIALQVEKRVRQKGGRYSGKACFRFFDVNRNGYIEIDEVEGGIAVLKLTKDIPDTLVDEIFKKLDPRGKGRCTESQFIRVMKGKETANYLSGSESDDSEREVENFDGDASTFSDSDDERVFKQRKNRGKKKSSYDFSETDSNDETDKSDYDSFSTSSLSDDEIFERPRRSKHVASDDLQKTVQKRAKRARKRDGRHGVDLYEIFLKMSKKEQRKNGSKNIKKNVISKKGFTRVIDYVGIDFSKKMLKKIISKFSRGKRGSLVNYHLFLLYAYRDYNSHHANDGDLPDDESLSGSEIRAKLRRVIVRSNESGIDVVKMFEVFDKNGDRLLSADELRSASLALGLSMSRRESLALVRYVDKDNKYDGKIDYDELLDFVRENQKDITIDEIESKIKDAIHTKTTKDGSPLVLEEEFARFDLNGDGYISVKEFRKTLRQSYDLELSDKEYKNLLARVDKNGDGKIDYAEFAKKYHYGKKDMEVLAVKLRKRFLDIAVDRAISFQEIFRSLDSNGDGVISRREFRMALNKTTTNLTERELRSLMDKFDSKRKGRIDYKAFIKFASPKDSDLSDLEKLIRDRVRDVARVRGGVKTLNMVAPFENKDVNGDGKITVDEFKHAIESLGLDITDREFRLLCARFDSNGDGYIDYKSFCKFAQLDDKETMEMCRRLKKKLKDAAAEEIYVRDVFAKHDPYNRSGRITKLQFREGARYLKLALSTDERLTLEDRFKALDNNDDFLYLEFLKWVNNASDDGTRRAAWHGEFPSDKDILNTTVQDDEVWNSRTVRTWLNTQASPRQRRRFNRLYASLSSYKQNTRRGGHKYPKPGNLDATSFMDIVDSDGFSSPRRSNRLKDPALDIMSSTLKRGRTYGNTSIMAPSTPVRNRNFSSSLKSSWKGNDHMLNSSVHGDMMGSMMSRLQLSAIETGDVTEQEFRDNRSLFQQTGNWACPVCMFPNNKDFSRKCSMCASANPYMLPMGASNSPMKFSFTASRTAGGFSSPRSSSHIENALDGTVAWRGDESEDDRYVDSDEENERGKKKTNNRGRKKYSDDEDDYRSTKKGYRRSKSPARARKKYSDDEYDDDRKRYKSSRRKSNRRKRYSDHESGSEIDSPRTRSDRRRRQRERY